MLSLFWMVRRRPESASSFAFSFRLCWLRQELWRGLSASLMHVDSLHLCYTLLGLWLIRRAEEVDFSGGLLSYLAASLAFITIARMFHIVVASWLVRRGMRSAGDAVALGYGAPIVGWLTAIALDPHSPPITFFGRFSVQASLAPLFYIVLGRALIPHQGVALEHIGGLLGGALAAAGSFNFLHDTYWALALLCWAYLIVGTSLRCTLSSAPVPLVDYVQVLPASRRDAHLRVRALNWRETSLFAEYALDRVA
jgi:membrane associated rhomboid family serine protease